MAFAALVFACGGDPGPLVIPELSFGAGPHFPEQVVLPPVGAGRIVITNSLEDSVSLLPLADVGSDSFGELARLPVGLNPVELEGVHHATISPDGAHYFVALSMSVGAGSGPHGAHGAGDDDGYVVKYRVADHARVGWARVEENPGDLVASADGTRLFVTHYDLNRIRDVALAGGPESEMDSNLVIVDAGTMRILERVRLCPAAHGVRQLSDGRLVASCLSDEVAVVDVSATPAKVTRVKLPNAGSAVASAHEPYAVTESPDGAQVWVSTLKSRSVFLLDTASLTFDESRTIGLGGEALFGTFTSAGDRLFVPFQRLDEVAEIDPRTGALLPETIPLPGCLNVHQVTLTPDEAHLLAVCEGDHRGAGALVVIELATRQRRNLVELGVFPDYVGVIEGTP